MSSNPRQSGTLDRGGQKTADNTRPMIRRALILSSVAMLAFAGLTFAGVMRFPTVVGYAFVAVALADLLVAFTVFRD